MKNTGKKKGRQGTQATLTAIGEKKTKAVRRMGNNMKTRAVQANIVSLVDPKTNKSTKATIQSVLENHANAHYKRLGILTKGAIIQTSAGKAKVTSRPGQNGSVSAVKIEE